MLDEFDKSTLYLLQSLTRSTTHDKRVMLASWQGEGNQV